MLENGSGGEHQSHSARLQCHAHHAASASADACACQHGYGITDSITTDFPVQMKTIQKPEEGKLLL